MLRFLALIAAVIPPLSGAPPFQDRVHWSSALGEFRHYRIFLPPDYHASGRRYPVIYYFHGHSDRYTLEGYDRGRDTVPKIASFVKTHAVIVVAPDGYVARAYTAAYAGDPYDLRRSGGDLDFGAYFTELVRYIDNRYRTRTARRYRGTSGLSMGGFMSLYLSARYPDLVGSASAFNPGPEFYVGEKGRRALWRPKDFVANHEHTMVRLTRASGDFISQYHEETREAYSITPSVPFEYRQDDYHRHWATSIAETFEFHMRAFGSASLDHPPVDWSYAGAYRDFHVHGYHLSAELDQPATIYLRHVRPTGLAIDTRQWAPDGPPAKCVSLVVDTAPIYQPGASYRVLDFSRTDGLSAEREMPADASGRLHLQTDCGGHEIGITGPGASPRLPVTLPVTGGDFLRLPPDRAISFPLRLLNTGVTPVKDVSVELTSDFPTVQVLHGKAFASVIQPGSAASLGDSLQIRLIAGNGYYARARLLLNIAAAGSPPVKEYVDVLVEPENIPQPLEVAVLDGRSRDFPVFRQHGNQGGGASIMRHVSEGRGNGNGILEPGEQATIWVRVRQGLDPFDKSNWYRAKIYSDSPWLSEVADLQEDKQLEWTSAQNRTSVVQLASQTPPDAAIPLILDCETWSFQFTPDLRFGVETLYQAFQLHQHQLFAWTWKKQ